MRVKVAVIAAIVCVAVGVGTLRTVSGNKTRQKAQQSITRLEEKERDGTIRLSERVQLAKARGLSHTTAPAPLSLYPQALNPEHLDEVLPRYTVVIARDMESKSLVGTNDLIKSWHKFKIIKTLSTAPPVPSYVTAQPPAELLPLNDDEFLLQRVGGTINLDGVVVTSTEPNVPSFKRSERYLLVLSLDPATRTAQLALGPQSILPVNPDNSLDEKNQEHMLQRALQAHHKNSVEQLRADLQKRGPAR